MEASDTDERQALRNRLRAARAYKDVSLDELAEACDVNRGIVTRWLRTERPQRFPAEAYGPFALRCGVPEDWLRHGWQEAPTPTAAPRSVTAAQRLELLGQFLVPLALDQLEGSDPTLAATLRQVLQPEV